MTVLLRTIIFRVTASLAVAISGASAKEPAVTAKTKALAVESLDTISEARNAAKRIGRGFTEYVFSYKEDSNTTYMVRQHSAALSNASELTIHHWFCREGRGCRNTKTWRNGLTRFDLDAIDQEAILVFDVNGKYGFVLFGCRDDEECVQSGFDTKPSTSKTGVIACRNAVICRRMKSDLQALIIFAKKAQGAAPSHTGRKKKSTDSSTQPADRSEFGKRIRPSLPMRSGALTDLNNSLLGAEILVAVTEGATLHLLRGTGASRDGNRHLVVHRDACLALIKTGNPQSDVCKPDDRWTDYDLVIDLAAVELNSIRIDQGGYWAGEKGPWISAQCRTLRACARLSVLSRSPQANAQRRALSRNFRETAVTPKIRLPCRDAAGCNKAAQALRTLVNGASADRITGTGHRRLN